MNRTDKTIVVALARGYDNQVIREPGEVFEMPADTRIEPGAWFVLATDEQAAQMRRGPTAAPPPTHVNDLV